MDDKKKPVAPGASRANAAPNAPMACQICGKVGGVVYDPEKAPPNRLCYQCAAEYGMQDSDEE